MSLSGVDYLVIGVYLLAITAFGSWFARYQKTTRDYFLTDRSVPWWAICFTIVATETSTLTFIGIPAQAYAGNMTFLQLAIGYVIGRVIVSVLFIPAYFRGDLFTSYELLQRRFGTRVKTLSAVIFLITRSLADGIRLFTTALVISIVTQVPVTVGRDRARRGDDRLHDARRRLGGDLDRRRPDVRLHRRRRRGGDRAARTASTADGPRWCASGRETGRFVVIDASFDFTKAYTLWAGLLGGVALTLSTHGTDQYLVQRLLSAQIASEAASTGLVLSGFIVFAQFILFLLIGVMLYTYYQQMPLPQALARHRPDPADLRRQRAAATASPVSSSRRSWPRRCRRRSTRWPRRPSAISICPTSTRRPIRPRRCACRSRRRSPGAWCSSRSRSARSS